MSTQITLPEMGEGVIEGTLARWLVREGDRVERYAPIAEVETDKVTTETTTETAGTILRLLVGEGETIPVGTVMAIIGEPGEETTADGRPSTTPKGEISRPTVDDRPQTTDSNTPAADTPLVAVGGRLSAVVPYTGRISPVVGRIAAEHGVDLSRVTGTGRDGRITKDDILAYVAGMTADGRPATADGGVTADGRPATADGGESSRPTTTDQRPPTAGNESSRPTTDDRPQTTARSTPAADAPLAAVSGRPTAVGGGGSGDADLLPLTNIRRAIAEHMVRSKHTSPHVTTVFEFDFSAVAAHRKAHVEQFARDGVRLTYTAYLVAATVQALKAHPLANSSWSDEGILLHRAVNIGMATAIGDGLIVPVIKNADGLNLLGLARAVNDLADRARAKQLKPDEVKGGTFSITNHGTSGSLFATPIINQPQCGILGVGAIEKRVKVIDDAIAIRPLAYVSFTFDHRILDGASADGFVSAIKREIEGYKA